ncbi:M61 family metallopeptidase [Candidatus Berkiella aquae]|uniref:M61 glycyl aminopeptidase n=1 Tax=Candidatus Berkiella aquae TaxID=295108 RepID=A0A0Q9YEK9_9GAMM|nr:hypothetical protein [Candidatus Berkiella aquae]MCS5711649.1 hypothetical protein [Candidatus Berkiella aquae]
MKINWMLRSLIIGIILHSPIGYTKTSQIHDLIYKINYLGGAQSNCLDISAGIRGNQNETIKIKFPEYVNNFSLKANEGNISYTLLENRTILVSLKPNVDMEANYQICVDNPIRDNERPIIEEEFFHFAAEKLLAVPDVDLETVYKIKIQLNNFPKNFSIATNHNINKREYEIETSVEQLSRSIIAGGNIDIRTIFIKEKPVHILMNGKWAMFDVNELIDYLHKIISLQRDVLEDHHFPHFVLIFYDNKLPEGESGVVGSLYENVLSMVITDGKPKNKPILFGLISHELFHAWLGNKIRISRPQGDKQWFFEGVNDFYGWQLALETGMISKQDYLEYYNKLLKEYMTSPFRESNNQEIAAAFKLRNPAGRLVMFRGHILFMEMLNKLDHRGQFRKPIDTALQEILENASDVNLDAIFRKHVGKDIWDETAAMIQSGKIISLSPTLFSNEVKLKNQTIEIPDVGFNLKSLVKEKRIRSLVKNSPASKAGLKENVKIIDYGLDLANPQSNVYITLEDKGNAKTVSFKPETAKRIIPQYENKSSQQNT